ncbi:MAG: fibrobacter succinogenes major paralogous domain-containing protein [Bacteroidales bacterium]|nr:fibrobacter succinogenes major paralogous domain-containing protein [Bacteroidales bacterium]
MRKPLCILIVITISMVLTAQNGGMHVGDLNADGAVKTNAAASTMIELSDGMVFLPPMTNSEIQLIPNPRKGAMIYSSNSDVLVVYDGYWWKRADGKNDTYIFNKTCERSYQDQDGNTFLGVEIGNQCWMDRNLAVTKYPNGVSIPHVTDNTEWSALGNNDTDDAYCYYENTVNLEYGALYTYAAAIAKNWANDKNEGQGICPDGWHLPTDAEWTTLTEYLGGPAEAGKKLKEEGTEHWKTPNTGATNESGFTALPGGSHGNANFYF